MRRAPATALATAAVALIAAGCGSGSSHPSAANMHTKLTRAAFVSTSTSGYKLKLSMTEDLGSAGTMTETGSGSFSAASKSGSLSLAMKIPGLPAALGQMNVDVIIRGSDYYIKLPAAISGLISHGRPWLSFNLKQVGSVAGIPELGSIVSSEQSLSDPTQYLTFLKAVSSSGIKNLGSQQIDGVQTTHYQAQIDVSKLPDVVPAADRQATQQLMNVLKQHEHLGLLPVDVWLDSQNRVRRITLQYSMPVPSSTTTSTTPGAAAKTASLAITEDFLSYGPQPVPAAPPASQTANLMSLLKGLGSLLGSATTASASPSTGG